jgi:hypothetical protein
MIAGEGTRYIGVVTYRSLNRLMARGAIQRSGGKPGGHPPVHAKRKGRLVSEIVIADRR